MLPHASGKAPGGASCFYFTLRPNLTQLDGRHSVFGEVVEGVDTLERINDAFVDTNHIPLTVRILVTTISFAASRSVHTLKHASAASKMYFLVEYH